MIVAPGSTSQSIQVQLVDDAGLPLTGKVYTDFPTTGYQLAGAHSAASITLASLADLTTAYSSGGVKEIGGGWYRLDLPNGALTTAGQVVIYGSASGKHVRADFIDVQYPSVNLQTIKTQAVTCAAGVTVPASIGTSTLSQTQVTGGAYSLQTDGSGYLKLSNGGGTGQINLSGGVVQQVLQVTGDIAGRVLGFTSTAFSGVGVQADLQTIKTQSVTAAAGVTFPGSIGTSTFATGGSVNVDKWNTVDVTGMPMPTYTQPTGFLTAVFAAHVGSATAALATDGSGRVLLQPTQTGVTIPTVTALTNLPAASANWLTAAAIASGALNGKGDWMASYTQPAGFLAATFPTTVASPTNITAGTVTTTTNLTNAPTAGDFTAAMKASLNAATPASVQGAVGSVTGGVGGNVAGKVLGGGAGTITGTGARVVDASGNAVAPASTTTAAAISAAVMDTSVVETGWTLRQVLRLLAAVGLGKSSNSGNTFRDVNDTKARVTGTVDASGNRTVSTLDAS
jgi:hypothetical protein